MERMNILYRGPLSSCNYECSYCPFAKRQETTEELSHDRECLQRFLDWLKERSTRLHGIFFTPWGEALTRRWYRDAIVTISNWDHIERVAIQTNISVKLDWLSEARLERVGLWCTYHPSEISRDRFLSQCKTLDRLGARYSVGMVGSVGNVTEMERMRDALPKGVYLWINAMKSSVEQYDENVIDQFTKIDPNFPTNNTYHTSLGEACNTGQSVVSIDGDGNVRRCHFVKRTLGNIYEQELESMLSPRPCPNSSCGCHIGYVHMPKLGLEKIYGRNILERIPVDR